MMMTTPQTAGTDSSRRNRSSTYEALLESAGKAHGTMASKRKQEAPKSRSPQSVVTTQPSAAEIMPKIARAIVDKVQLNRVTIVVGPTGSGKSTLIPPLLLEKLGSPILCSQPRRLAVVAIAKRVAFNRGVELGGSEVGYHVGNHNFSTRQTKLLFTTAGILLEELRANGIGALTKCKCVVIDECHERSPESDLVLGMVKQFMTAKPRAYLRVILMSATFNHDKYKAYFAGVPGCEAIDTITLETGASFDSFHSMVETFYLEDISRQLPAASNMKPFFRTMRLNPEEDLAYDDGRSLSQGIVTLVVELVSWLDKKESMGSPFLIFAPTYRHLEQMYEALAGIFDTDDEYRYRVDVLHSSVDIEDCLRTMGMSTTGSNQRHLFLASAIADSSITVPGVSCVIDLCRTLEVRYHQRAYHAKTIWASKSICDQRRGRTGRTCPGKVYRFLPKGFYIANLPNWDVAQLTLSSCHNETLKVVCSSHALSKDPRKLLEGCLDAPKSQVVDDAVQYLVEIGACIEKVDSKNLLSSRSGNGTSKEVIPTPYGALLGSLPLTVAEAKVVLAGASIGMLHEMLALQAIYSQKPTPLVQSFGRDYINKQILESYYDKAKPTDGNSVALANLSAYMFWDVEWNHRRRHKTVALMKDGKDASELLSWTPELEEENIEWCRRFQINPTSVRSISELIENTMAAFYLAMYEPDWLRCADPTPIWKRPADWRGPLVPHGREMLERVYGGRDASVICDALRALCVSRGDATKAAHLVQKLPGMALLPGMECRLPTNNEPEACIHFLMGNCRYGNKCLASHSPFARRPQCRYYQNGNCTKGDACIFAHGDDDDRTERRSNTKNKESRKRDPLLPMLPLREEFMVFGETPTKWFSLNHKLLCLLGEGNFKFTYSLGQMGYPPALSTTFEEYYGRNVNRLGLIDATKVHMKTQIRQMVQNFQVRSFAWNFPFVGHDEDSAANEELILKTFQSTAVLLQYVSDHELVPEFHFGLALQGDQFSRWNVFRSAYWTGWRLLGWSEFSSSDFPGYRPCRANGEEFPATVPRFYAFKITKHDLPRYNVM